ncbi:hypothetical protein FPRO06_11032 [Fusarium proliferatum]|nr:hypothetical protein FPRO06_11032 [Fusarium proliferatum]
MLSETPPEKNDGFEYQNLRPGELLRWVYDTLPGILQNIPIPGQTLVLDNPIADSSVTEDNDKEEENFKVELCKRVVKFEAKLSSRSGVHNFQGEDPLSDSETQARNNNIEDVLGFLSTQLAKMPNDDIIAYKSSLPSSAEQNTDVAFSPILESLEYSKRNGHVDGGWFRMLTKLPYALWESLAEMTGNLNKSVENRHVKKDIDLALAKKRTEADEPVVEQQSLRHDELLYHHLASQICPAGKHQVLLQLPRPDSKVWHIRMPRCSDKGEKTSCLDSGGWWERTQIISVTIDKDMSNTLLDGKKAQSWKNLKPLNDRLETYDQVGIQSPREAIARFRLALQVCQAVFYLFPGPWIQQEWTSGLFQAPWSERSVDEIADLAEASILCDLRKNWSSQNHIYQAFLKTQVTPSPDPPGFFLSLAQLLVDICEGRSRVGSAAIKDSDSSAGYIRSKIAELTSNPLLKFYGCAIESCRTYDFLYREASPRGRQPQDLVRSIGEKHVINHLQDVIKLWESRANDMEPAPDFITSSNPLRHTEINCEQDIKDTLQSPRGSVFTLFGDELWEKSEGRPEDRAAQQFRKNWKIFYDDYVRPSPKSTVPSEIITIAVLDTGLHRHESDNLLKFCKNIDKRRCRDFTIDINGETEGPFDDVHGHGTQVVRILLDYAPRAKVVVLKISEKASLEKTQLIQVKNALRYAGTFADIITLSFGLDDAAQQVLQPVIVKLVKSQKLIFAAASNSGGNGKRAYPANQCGVFAIHATKGDGSPPDNLNPPALNGVDNFATLGWEIPSFWNGNKVVIKGTSFATPIAAALAANLMEIIRCTPTTEDGKGSRRVSGYGDMHKLLSTMQHEIGNYQYLRPWAQGMFDGSKDLSEMQDVLQDILIGHSGAKRLMTIYI